MARTKIPIFRRTRGLSNAQLVAREPWIVDLDAVTLTDAIADAVGRESASAIRSGRHGTVQGRPRGLNTGRLVNSFGHTQPRAGAGGFKASSTVRSQARDRLEFLKAEADRGINYISAERASAAIDKAIRRWLDEALD